MTRVILESNPTTGKVASMNAAVQEYWNHGNEALKKRRYQRGQHEHSLAGDGLCQRGGRCGNLATAIVTG